MTIVNSHYRYERPPKRKKAVPREVPAVLKISAKTRRSVSDAAKRAGGPYKPRRPRGSLIGAVA
jgi:hypothetical protein